MDPEYGTKRRAVPLLVEDVAGSQTSVKVEEIGAKVDKLASIVESTVPRGCYSHWRIVDKTTGEVINQSMLDNATFQPEAFTHLQDWKYAIINVNYLGTYTKVKLYMTRGPSNIISFVIPKPDLTTQNVEIFNPYDSSVPVFVVETTEKDCPYPFYLKHISPYPNTSAEYLTFYPNGRDVNQIYRAVGNIFSAEDSNTVVGLLKSISNKL